MKIDWNKFNARFAESRGTKSLRKLAVDAGVKYDLLYRVAKGQKPDVDTFFAMCDWMSEPVDEFRGTGEPEVVDVAEVDPAEPVKDEPVPDAPTEPQEPDIAPEPVPEPEPEVV